MADPRACDSCGSRYQPLRATSRYCSGRCRKRAQRSGVAASTDRTPAAGVPQPPQARVATLHAAVLSELLDAERASSALGQACLALASRIDHAHGETGSALAALVRELRASLDAALAESEPQLDVLDEMARKRKERLARAGL